MNFVVPYIWVINLRKKKATGIPLCFPPVDGLLLFVEEACDPDSHDEENDAQNTKLAELVTSQKIQEGKLGKRQKP